MFPVQAVTSHELVLALSLLSGSDLPASALLEKKAANLSTLT